MKQLNEGLFRTICLAFSALVLILFLLTTIDIATERDKRERLVREVNELADENERLRARAQQDYSLEEIERYARERLGMQAPAPGQIVYLKPAD